MKIEETSDKDVEVYYDLVEESKPIVLQTQKGHCVLAQTKAHGETLFIDGMLQCSRSDEYIYHEMIVHTLFDNIPRHGIILILGGAEGCIAREVLKWPDVEEVHQVDWDKELVEYFKKNGEVWNNGSYNDSRLHLFHMDVLEFFKQNHVRYDAILVDLFDPSSDSIDMLKKLIPLIKESLYPEGGFIMNAGAISPQNQQFCLELIHCIQNNSMSYSALHIEVPSFISQWCLLIGKLPIEDDNEPFYLLTKHYTQDAVKIANTWSKEYDSAFIGCTKLNSEV